MAANAYLTITAQKQGQIDGGVTQKGREKTILVRGFTNEITTPRDATSGLPTGKRLHLPVIIVKEIDKASVPLWSALVNNENLTDWRLQCYAPNPSGVEQLIYTITLTNASIASIREFMLDNSVPANATLPLHEEITFTYQKIQWAWANPPILAQDDWQAPVT